MSILRLGYELQPLSCLEYRPVAEAVKMLPVGTFDVDGIELHATRCSGILIRSILTSISPRRSAHPRVAWLCPGESDRSQSALDAGIWKVDPLLPTYSRGSRLRQRAT